MSDAGTVPEFFDVLLHLGTLVAVFVAYWADIKDMVLEFFRGAGDLIHHSTPNPVPPARRLILLIILGTLPLFVVLPVKDAVQSLSNSMVFIGAALIVTGVLLFVSDRVKKGRKNERTATWLDVLIVGLGQGHCDDARHLPLRYDDHDRLLRRLRAQVRRPLFIPAEHPCGSRREHPEPGRRGKGRDQLGGGARLPRRRRDGGRSWDTSASACCASSPTAASSARLPTTAGPSAC